MSAQGHISSGSQVEITKGVLTLQKEDWLKGLLTCLAPLRLRFFSFYRSQARDTEAGLSGFPLTVCLSFPVLTITHYLRLGDLSLYPSYFSETLAFCIIIKFHYLLVLYIWMCARTCVLECMPVCACVCMLHVYMHSGDREGQGTTCRPESLLLP